MVALYSAKKGGVYIFYTQKAAETIVVRWTDASALMESLAKKSDGAHILKYESRPPVIEEFIRALPRSKEKLEGVAPDQVLDQELVDTYAV